MIFNKQKNLQIKPKDRRYQNQRTAQPSLVQSEENYHMEKESGASQKNHSFVEAYG